MPVSSRDLAHAGLDERLVDAVLRAGDALPEAGRVGALEQQHSSSAVWMTTSTDSGILKRASACRPLRVAQADVQLAQLLLVDRARRVGEQVLRALRLREGDHVAERLGAGHQHHEAVEADRDAAVRRRAVLQRVEQEAELGARFLGVDLERAEHLALHVLAVDPHRAAAELEAVQHDVVGLGDAAPGIGLEPVLVAVLRARERMVHGAPALLGPRRTRTSGSRPPRAAPTRPAAGRATCRTRCGRS